MKYNHDQDEPPVTGTRGQQANESSTPDLSVVQLIDKLIIENIKKNASDIHFEPYEAYCRIRSRIDGILHEVTRVEPRLAPRLIARLKIMAGLDIAEKRIPQDVRYSFNLGKTKSVDLRVNSCPTLFGEKIVLRILNAANIKITIDQLGLSAQQQKLFLKTLNKTQGMILVTGPTGCGKTVTLYSALNSLNKVEKNISTVEDPIEIYLPGINQVNINSKIGLEFSTVLRAFLRQDPDIIMLGEIRDQETAKISIKAAQTGHLVLSTLHTNNTIEALIRLHNMGVATFNLATSVNLIVAQRLVRCLCTQCKIAVKFNRNTLLEQGFKANELPTLKLYQATGCEKCTTGYHGRTAIFELLPITAELRNAMLSNHHLSLIYQSTNIVDWVDLRQASLNKVRQGITSLEEINRVII